MVEFSVRPSDRSPTPEEQDAPEPGMAGDFLVDDESKAFEPVKAEPGRQAPVSFSAAFEGSIGLVTPLNANPASEEGFRGLDPALRPRGVILGVQRGLPRLGDEAFPGRRNVDTNFRRLPSGSGKVHACRFALRALRAMGKGR